MAGTVHNVMVLIYLVSVFPPCRLLSKLIVSRLNTVVYWEGQCVLLSIPHRLQSAETAEKSNKYQMGKIDAEG